MSERSGHAPHDESRDELDRRIDQALRRRFEPPRSLASLAERALAPRPPAHGGLRRLALSAAAAAALVAAATVAWRSLRSEPPELPEAPRAPERVARVVHPRLCQPVGPLVSSADAPREVHSPDLKQLYCAMDACQRSAAALPCPENDGLAERLRATYGSELQLNPDALGFLQGPFASADWPTATILTGFAEDHTSVLVAERDATLDCCLCMDLPEQSGLQMFTWQVGDLVLTEITPLSEPRLIEFFE